MSIVITLVIFVIAALGGLAVWASSDRPLVLREIALNSRREGQGGSDYVFLKILSALLKVFGVIVWNAGLLAMVLFNISDFRIPL